MSKNELVDRSYSFALRIVKLSRYLVLKREFVVSNQILKSRTSIGANIAEAQQAESKRDFTHKLRIANKEASETNFWLRLLRDSDSITPKGAKSMLGDCNSIQRKLTSAIKKLNADNLQK